VFSRERVYMFLLRTYFCTTTDSIGILKSKVLEHYTSICAKRDGFLNVYTVCLVVLLFVCPGLSVCIIYRLSCLPLRRINVFITLNVVI